MITINGMGESPWDVLWNTAKSITPVPTNTGTNVPNEFDAYVWKPPADPNYTPVTNTTTPPPPPPATIKSGIGTKWLVLGALGVIGTLILVTRRSKTP